MKFILKISVLLMLLLFAKDGFSQKKKEIAPKKYLGKVVLKGKGEYTYYALSEINTTEYKVEGPGILYVNFRVRLEEDQLESQPFKVKELRSGKHVSYHTVPTLPAGNLKFKNKGLSGAPTKSHRVRVEVPPGKHTYRFYKYKASQKVHARAFFEKHLPPRWTSIQPTNPVPSKKVVFKKSGKQQAYLRLEKGTSVDFSVNKDSHVRMIVRPEFTYKMLSETVVRVRLTDLTTGQSTVYKLNARKSGAAEFSNDKKNTVGSASKVYLHLNTPKGVERKYKVNLLSGAKAVVIRLSDDQNYVPSTPIAGK